MLSLLFDGGFWYDLLFIALAIGIVYLCFKYKSAKYWVATIAMVALVIFTGYCGIQLNAYYSAEGGIWGYIDGLINPNTGTVQVAPDKLEFTIDNIVMTEQIDGTYSAKIYLPDVLQLEEGKNYSVSVNDEPCSKVEFSAGTTSYARAEYAYAFLDTNLNNLCVDTLVFNVSLFKTSTDVTISSNGGQTAVDYWNTYFAKNEFNVSIFADDYVRDDSIEYVDGDVSNYHTLTYYVDDEVFTSQIFNEEQAVNLIDAPEKADHVFSHWVNSFGTKVNNQSRFFADTALYAVYVEAQVLPFTFDGNKVTGYTGTSTEIVIPATYSLSAKGQPIVGDDITVTKVDFWLRSLDINVTSVTIPETITVITADFWYQAPNLARIEFLGNFGSINDQWFYETSSYAELILHGDEVLKLYNWEYATTGLRNGYRRTYVPANLLEAYKTAEGWEELADRIFAI